MVQGDHYVTDIVYSHQLLLKYANNLSYDLELTKSGPINLTKSTPPVGWISESDLSAHQSYDKNITSTKVQNCRIY